MDKKEALEVIKTIFLEILFPIKITDNTEALNSLISYLLLLHNLITFSSTTSKHYHTEI